MHCEAERMARIERREHRRRVRDRERGVVGDPPAGPVRAVAACRDGRCEGVELTNVPSFADSLDARLEGEGLGSLTVDVAFGGMWYAIADAAELGFELEPSEARDLSEAGEVIRLAAREQLPCVHPENDEIAGVSIAHLSAMQITDLAEWVGGLAEPSVAPLPQGVGRAPRQLCASARVRVGRRVRSIVVLHMRRRRGCG